MGSKFKITLRHAEYEKRLVQWTKLRDAIAGEEAIKAKGEVYLPRLSGQKTYELNLLTGQPSEYEAYKQRAMFYAATGRTVEGLGGAILRKDPDLVWPESKKDILQRLGVAGETLDEIVNFSLQELIGIGRVGLLVDAPSSENAEPFVAIYTAENITNWKEEVVAGRRTTTMITLREIQEVEDSKGVTCALERFRCLKLGIPLPMTEEESKMSMEDFLGMFELSPSDFEEGGVYYQEIWIQNVEKSVGGDYTYSLVGRVVPKMNGGKLIRRIPFVFLNPSSSQPTPEKPPLLDLVNVNLSHYRNSADLEHGRHFTALPTAYAAGFDIKGELRIGSEVAWLSDNPSARAGYLEFTGAGLGHIAAGMTEKEKLMAVLGSRLLEEQKAGVEAADTLRLRQSGEQSVLARISIAASEGLTKILSIVAEWLAVVDSAKVSIKLNRDFNLAGLDASVLTSLMGMAQGGLISWNTFFFNLKRGELIPDGVNEKDEAARIQEGLPMGAPGAIPAGAEVEEEEEEITTGETNGHTHTFKPGDSTTSEEDGHTHGVVEDEEGDYTIQRSEGHTHTVPNQ